MLAKSRMMKKLKYEGWERETSDVCFGSLILTVPVYSSWMKLHLAGTRQSKVGCFKMRLLI